MWFYGGEGIPLDVSEYPELIGKNGSRDCMWGPGREEGGRRGWREGEREGGRGREKSRVERWKKI